VLKLSVSRLYSEKAYVLSRNFVRRALELPVGSLQSELEWMYFTNGKLGKVISDARSLIEKSNVDPVASSANGVDEEERAVPRLSQGGILTLTRTLGKLQVILDARASVAS
jgi:ubiquitin-conjugating enzyme E2 O